jgi:hypothetical protein
MKSDTIVDGGMAEWFKAAVLKTVDGETRPGVRIPLPPPTTTYCSRCTYKNSNCSATIRGMRDDFLRHR